MRKKKLFSSKQGAQIIESGKPEIGKKIFVPDSSAVDSRFQNIFPSVPVFAAG
jgi:hypothetical protein